MPANPNCYAVMARREERFTDSLPLGEEDKRVIWQTRGKWFVEFAELKGWKAKRAVSIKAFPSRHSNRARGVYRRRSHEVPRT